MFKHRSSKNLVSAICTLGVFCFLITGCRGLVNLKTDYLKENNAQIAMRAISDKIGKPFKIFKVEIEKDSFIAAIQNPQNPGDLDQYQYSHGVVLGPTPIHSDSYYDFKKYVFDYDERDFSAIQTLVRDAEKAAQIENAKVTHLTLNRGIGGHLSSNLPASDFFQVRWLLEIRGSRADSSAVADEKGKLITVDLSKTTAGKTYEILNAGELGKAQDAIKKLIGDEKKIYKIEIWIPKDLAIFLPNPQDSHQIDNYVFNIFGLNRKGNSDLSLIAFGESFSINDIQLADAEKLVQKAATVLNIHDKNINSIAVERETTGEKRVTWTIVIGSSLVIFDARGNVIGSIKH